VRIVIWNGFQLPDFYSGATDRIGRFTEGFLLRRLHRSCARAYCGENGRQYRLSMGSYRDQRLRVM
jgi:hypothetical protein